ncbi:hypothetical protein HWV62_20780 [Athelia sp. TMB]|nr:hypothetical protein HWV62_20780 [Athelia sp. TMB]
MSFVAHSNPAADLESQLRQFNATCEFFEKAWDHQSVVNLPARLEYLVTMASQRSLVADVMKTLIKAVKKIMNLIIGLALPDIVKDWALDPSCSCYQHPDDVLPLLDLMSKLSYMALSDMQLADGLSSDFANYDRPKPFEFFVRNSQSPGIEYPKLAFDYRLPDRYRVDGGMVDEALGQYVALYRARTFA